MMHIEDKKIETKRKKETKNEKNSDYYGSDSDFPVVKGRGRYAQELEIPFEVHVCLAHRAGGGVQAFVARARQNGFGVIIAVRNKSRIWRVCWRQARHCRSEFR